MQNFNHNPDHCRQRKAWCENIKIDLYLYNVRQGYEIMSTELAMVSN